MEKREGVHARGHQKEDGARRDRGKKEMWLLKWTGPQRGGGDNIAGGRTAEERRGEEEGGGMRRSKSITSGET